MWRDDDNNRGDYISPLYEDFSEEDREIDEDSISNFENEGETSDVQEIFRKNTINMRDPWEKQDAWDWKGSKGRDNSPPNWGNSSVNKSYSPWSDSGNYSGFGKESNYNNYNRKESIRNKKVIICDFLDGIVETYQSNGRAGYYVPRGTYDLKVKFEVWDRIGRISPTTICPIVPESILNCARWGPALNYIGSSLEEYLRMNVICSMISQSANKSKEEVISAWLSANPDIKNSEVLFIGSESGGPGQGYRDYQASVNLGIDYLDINVLLNQY